MAKRRASLFITERERHELEARFRRDMRALRERLHKGAHPRETREQFYERVFTQFEAILARHQGFATGLRVPLRRGRPPRLDKEPTAPPGRPKKFTSADEAHFLADIDRWKAKLADKRRPATDSSALRWSIANSYFKRYLAEGRSKPEAERLAKEMAKGKLFKNRKEHLSRLRSRARKR